MNINNKDFKSHFHGDVVSFALTTMEIENEVYFPDGSFIPILNATILRPQTRELLIDFSDALDMSNFAAELSKPCVIDVDDGYLYEGILVSKSESQEGIRAFTGTYSFQVIKRKSLKIESTETFFVEGNCDCGCIYEITASQEREEVCVDGMTIYGMHANQTIILDGIDKLIYDKEEPSISMFDSIDLLSFPKLIPGLHQMKKSDETIAVVIKYYPIFM